MKKRSVQKNFLDKPDEVRKKMIVRFPTYDVQNLTKMMSRLAHYYYNKKKLFVYPQF